MVVVTTHETASELLMRKAGRPRNAQSHQAILEATLTLFAEVGLQGLSIEAIAERAGVGKTTIYRRWSSKEAIIKDALGLFRSNNPLPTTGHIRSDLLFIVKKAREIFAEHPLATNLILKLMAEMKTQPEIYHAFRQTLVTPRIQEFRQMIESAQERGELRPDLDASLILPLIFSSLIYNNLFSELIVSETHLIATPEEAVDVLLRGIGTHEA